MKKGQKVSREGIAVRREWMKRYRVSEKTVKHLGAERLAAMSEDARKVLTNAARRDGLVGKRRLKYIHKAVGGGLLLARRPSDLVTMWEEIERRVDAHFWKESPWHWTRALSRKEKQRHGLIAMEPVSAATARVDRMMELVKMAGRAA